MELLVVPLQPRFEQLLREQLRRLAMTMTREQLVQLRLEQLYDWEKVEDPVTRRFFRASTLAWTPEELKALVEATLRAYLPEEEREEVH
ncbi:hypothetical protein D7Y13_08805 [Corallococcus praedator]|uniref:Uncharacterized protein n=1 Tax=Corallococcus praedator TaxID=2316724 RepID=A0ABX9QLP5_9BACT|nr:MULTISPECIES: hypothetical protein [Corallococcus]RKH33120.1 hypothetical protein D7X75_13290 [Corallococcus sp. CA031C]RKI12740.1 hypothetical protein D7Y13_08805 [Corallococcus praedator]